MYLKLRINIFAQAIFYSGLPENLARWKYASVLDCERPCVMVGGGGGGERDKITKTLITYNWLKEFKT